MFIIYLLSVGDILKANDDLSRAISCYKRIVEGQADDGEGKISDRLLVKVTSLQGSSVDLPSAAIL